MGWKFIGSTFNDSFLINDIDIFKEEWADTGKTALVIDPIYKKPFKFTVWKVVANGKTIVFAAGEFSNNVFGFFQK